MSRISLPRRRLPALIALLGGTAFTSIGNAQDAVSLTTVPVSGIPDQHEITSQQLPPGAAARAARRAAIQARMARAVAGAAARAAMDGQTTSRTALAPSSTKATAAASMAAAMVGQTPRYFSHPNYANSPLLDTLVAIVSADGSGTGATAAATVDPATGAITAITVTSPGSGYLTPPTVNVTSIVGTGSGAVASASIDSNGGVTGITLLNGGTGYLGSGIRKFVDGLPGLTAAGSNNLGQYLPVAVADTTTYADTDYYEIALVQYREKMHSDLPGTLLRGYVQLATGKVPGQQIALTNANKDGTETPLGRLGVDKPHYLGPIIVARKDRPVRIKFVNLLPTGQGGDLFLPVDTTVMGSGMGPSMGGMEEMDPQKPMCGAVPKPAGCYTENRATLHLHGGVSPWISDGTPHQWITPAGESTLYPQGVSVVPVPGMDDDGNAADGSMTFHWTNQQSGRLMFYHDHAWGITRLNVYAGEAAGYLIQDDKELDLVNRGLLPADQIPLVIQDKTFVPAASQLAVSDETWDSNRWGGLGQLWLPHVYSPAQNPGDASGINDYGRWAYGPWFWPATQEIAHGPIANPYYDSACNPDAGFCEPSLIPGTPHLSMGMESFHDTPLINGTAYPTITVDPKAYRLRILNAANDRFVNLSLYKAVDAAGTLCSAGNATPAKESTGVACTEVLLNPAEVAAALNDPAGVFPTPVAGTEGPNWIQVGSEGGFLPAPVVIPPTPVTWVTDPTVFNAGNVDQHALLIAPAERADVVVDFSAYAGQTLILYNDAPAAFPARDPRYDYYTGNPDLRDAGGTPPTQRGYGPNTRTVMQIKVANTPAAPAFNLPQLQAAFAHQSDGSGVFESSQHPIIVGQEPYNSAYGTAFQSNGPAAGLVQIYDTSFSFKTLAGGAGGSFLTFPLQPKTIQDEMGEAFEHQYGRMSGNLGVEAPAAQAGLQSMILYAYPHPPTEVIKGLDLPPGVAVAPIAAADDGTQVWKITHNGVDTHPIHFHLYDVQLVNRVGWDGIVRKPEANERGWKDTVRISPLEDTIVALRPIMPRVPFDMPNSVRLLDPSMPEGAVLASATQQDAAGKPIFSFSPTGEPIDIINHYINFGHEYVWHCHILSHEEMDMMRSQVIGVAPRAPTTLSVSAAGTTATLGWTDNSANETGFILQRANDGGFTSGLTVVQLGPNVTGYVDKTIKRNTTYYYRVLARNLVGDTWDYSDPALNEIPAGEGFPTMAMDSGFSNVAMIGNAPAAPAAPTNLATALQPGSQIRLTWKDNANNETGFVIERALDGVTFSALATAGTNATSYVDTVAAGNTYTYRVKALNAGGSSAYSNTSAVTVPLVTLPAAPSNLVATAVRSGNNARVTLTWADKADNETGFEIQRATNLNFTAGLTKSTVGPNVTTFNTGNIARGTNFYFRVRAFNSAGNSAWANTVVITTP